MEFILQDIDRGHHYSFSISHEAGTFLYRPWHYHPEAELALIKKGLGILLVGDHIEPFCDGDLILIGGNLPHLWRSDPEYFQGNDDLQMEAVAIHFMEDFWGKCFQTLPEMKQILELIKQAKRGIKMIGRTKRKLIPMMEKMLSAQNIHRITLLLDMLQLIATSGEYVSLSSAGFNESYDRGHTDNISQIYRYTMEHFQEEICIRNIASIVNLSHNSFCRYFKTHTNKTYGRFLLEVRIGYACKLLIENKMSISKISHCCGFNNLSNFNRRFKAFTGNTPSLYIKNHTKLMMAIL